MRMIAAVGIAALLSLCGAGHAQERSKAKGPGPKGHLAGLPSAEGPHIAKIRALGDNEWLNLGKPAPDPTYGAGRGRSWGARMPFAPDLNGAFLGGLGPHGFYKPDQRILDDVFFYEINAHRWICIYPGTDSTTFVQRIKSGDLKVRKDGQLVDGQEHVVPYNLFGGHSYLNHTYDENLKAYVCVFGNSGIGGDQYTLLKDWGKEGYPMLKAQQKQDLVKQMPYFYQTHTGLWERDTWNQPVGNMFGLGSCSVFYIPSIKKLWVYLINNTTYVSDYANKKWVNAGATGRGPITIDCNGCYDSKRDRIYMGTYSQFVASKEYKDKVFIYDVKTAAWSCPDVKGNKSFGHTNGSVTTYDSVNDRVLNMEHYANNKEKGIHVLDPETWAWEEPLAFPTSVPLQYTVWHGFYAPDLNVHFVYIAGDGQVGDMWAYRYKKAPRR